MMLDFPWNAVEPSLVISYKSTARRTDKRGHDLLTIWNDIITEQQEIDQYNSLTQFHSIEALQLIIF